MTVLVTPKVVDSRATDHGLKVSTVNISCLHPAGHPFCLWLDPGE